MTSFNLSCLSRSSLQIQPHSEVPEVRILAYAFHGDTILLIALILKIIILEYIFRVSCFLIN